MEAAHGIWIGSPQCNNLPLVQPIGHQHATKLFRFRRAAALLAATVAVMVTATSPASSIELGPPTGAVLAPDKLARIDEFVNSEIAAGKIPGAIVLIQRHGQPVYFKTFGKRDVEKGTPMTADAIFPIHSVTKTITSVAAMMLVDSGKIALSDPVSKYIPSFAGMKVGVERKDDAGRPVLDLVPLSRPLTIEDLLLHTSGITYGFYGEGLVKKAYAGIYLGDFDNAEFAERIARLPLAEQPRTLWDYGHSIDVLGRVIEVASGQSLYQFEKTHLLDPLGMTTTKFFLTDPEERARYAQPLAKDRHVERNSLDVTRWESGGGGMVSTISDFARYRADAAERRHTGRQDLSQPRDVCRDDERTISGRDPASSATISIIPATVSDLAMASASAPIPAMRCRRRRVRSARSSGTVRRASTSWSTAPRTCFSF